MQESKKSGREFFKIEAPFWRFEVALKEAHNTDSDFESLKIWSCTFTEQQPDNFREKPPCFLSIKHLLIGTSNINITQLERLLQMCPNLETFELVDCPNLWGSFSDEFRKESQVLSKLQKLEVDVRTTNTANPALLDGVLRHAAELKVLIFRANPVKFVSNERLSDHFLTHFKTRFTHLSQLSRVDLTHCTLSFAQIGDLFQTYPTIKEAGLYECNLTGEDFSDDVKRQSSCFSQLTVLRLAYTQISTAQLRALLKPCTGLMAISFAGCGGLVLDKIFQTAVYWSWLPLAVEFNLETACANLISKKTFCFEAFQESHIVVNNPKIFPKFSLQGILSIKQKPTVTHISVNEKTVGNQTVLQRAFSLGHTNIAKRLIAADADVSVLGDSSRNNYAEAFLADALQEMRKGFPQEEIARSFNASARLSPKPLLKLIDNIRTNTQIPVDPSQLSLFFKIMYHLDIFEDVAAEICLKIGEYLYGQKNDIAILFLKKAAKGKNNSAVTLYYHAYRELLGLPSIRFEGNVATVSEMLTAIPKEEQWRIELAKHKLAVLTNQLNNPDEKKTHHRRFNSGSSFFVTVITTVEAEKEVAKKQLRRTKSATGLK